MKPSSTTSKSSSFDLARRVGKRIRELRRAKHWSQQKLGKQVNFHRSYISQIEHGETNLTLKSLELLAKALEMDVVSLF